MSSLSDVLTAALSLNLSERAELAHQLLLSLEPGSMDEDVDESLANEIRRRRDAIREGRTTLRDWDEVLAELRQTIANKGPT
ncbi:MAG: addiction module protein [Planctomycetia bacterium]|nr:addiction module protein [Planctomycetia bacterium]